MLNKVKATKGHVIARSPANGEATKQSFKEIASLKTRSDARNDILLNAFVLASVALFLTGCAKLQHMDQLLTLKGLSDEQTRMGREIERQDARFERLVAAVEDGSIGRYKTRKSVSAKFGPPVFTGKTGEDGRTIEVWVYRYAAQFFDSPKVYLYWDGSGNLIRWDYSPKT